MATVLLALIFLAFIGLGLPSGLLGAAWPVMQPEFQVSYGLAGVAALLISGCKILASLYSARVLRRFGTGRVMIFCAALTSLALLGFAAAPSFWWILAAAVPLGWGAGTIDAGLNAYVVERYQSRHLSWLHSVWGLGAFLGPLVLSAFLAGGVSWRAGYLTVGVFQAVLLVAFVLALPLWDKVKPRPGLVVASGPPPPLLFPLQLRGFKLGLVALFFYCGIEATMGLWGGSYLFKARGLDAVAAATWSGFFFASLTAGRLLTGFATYRVSNRGLIRLGGGLIAVGAACLAFPLPLPVALAGFLLIGLGCAPIFPCLLHETPARFGSDHGPALVGFQMAVAFIGATVLPPAFGFLAEATSLALLPAFLLGYVAIFVIASETLIAVLRRPHPVS